MPADAGEHGSTDPSFLARFTPELLDVIDGGLAVAERGTITMGGRGVEVARVRITEKGRRVVENQITRSVHH